jgi:hypothetical protein
MKRIFIAGMALTFAIYGAVSAATAHASPHKQQTGVCVTYGLLPLIDADVHYAAKIYTPPCKSGDTFVEIGKQ